MQLLHPVALCGSVICDFDWNTVFEYKFTQINDNKVKQFNFKLLHRILPSKDNLCKWRIAKDNLCDICDTPETTSHFLLACKEVSMFWKIVSSIIMHIFKQDIIINEIVLPLGHELGNRKMNLVNLILIFAQCIIYRNYVIRGKEKPNACKIFVKEIKKRG